MSKVQDIVIGRRYYTLSGPTFGRCGIVSRRVQNNEDRGDATPHFIIEFDDGQQPPVGNVPEYRLVPCALAKQHDVVSWIDGENVRRTGILLSDPPTNDAPWAELPFRTLLVSEYGGADPWRVMLKDLTVLDPPKIGAGERIQIVRGEQKGKRGVVVRDNGEGDVYRYVVRMDSKGRRQRPAVHMSFGRHEVKPIRRIKAGRHPVIIGVDFGDPAGDKSVVYIQKWGRFTRSATLVKPPTIVMDYDQLRAMYAPKILKETRL